MGIHERTESHPVRRVLRTVIAAVGILSIVASGGGAFMPDIDFGGCCAVPFAGVEPFVQTVAVGDNATFSAFAFSVQPPLSYQWRRNGVDIAGATQARYTLAGANLGDDGAQFSVVVSGGNGSATSLAARLQVSPSPPIVFEDGDFASATWTVAEVPVPAQGGPTVTVARADTGGNPDAYRSLRYEMSAGPSSMDVFHSSVTAVYDPSTQGAIYGIDARADCIKTGGGETSVAILLEQDGRRFSSGVQPCTIGWAATVAQSSLRASAFVQIDGPACVAGQTCPDFSVAGAPIRFGMATASRIAAGQPAAVFTQGVDNWNVSVWRR